MLTRFVTTVLVCTGSCVFSRALLAQTTPRTPAPAAQTATATPCGDLSGVWIVTDKGVGNPYTNEMHIVERFRRIDHNTLEIDYLFNDPKAYTKPWGGKKVYKLRPETEFIEHVVCQDFLKLGKNR